MVSNMKKLSDELKIFKNKDLEHSLKRSYMLAMKEPFFQKLVCKIDMTDEILMKYTSQLEVCAFEKKNCEACESLLECKNEIEGFLCVPMERNSKLNFAYEPCSYKKEQVKKLDILNNITCYEIRKEIREAHLKDIYKDDKNRIPIIKKIKDFIDKYPQENLKGFYLHGNFGSGKTYFIAALFNELAVKKIKSAIVYYPEFLRSLKSSFSDNFGERIEYIKDVPLLLIDDIGAENVTAWGRDEILGTILQYRMESKLPTFFTSNLKIDELEQHLATTNDSVGKLNSRRIIERIKYLTTDIELIGINRRE